MEAKTEQLTTLEYHDSGFVKLMMDFDSNQLLIVLDMANDGPTLSFLFKEIFDVNFGEFYDTDKLWSGYVDNVEYIFHGDYIEADFLFGFNIPVWTWHLKFKFKAFEIVPVSEG